MKRFIAFAALIFCIQPARANPLLIQKLAQLREHIAINHPREGSLLNVLNQYCHTASPKWLYDVIDHTIGSQNLALHCILDEVLLVIETELKYYPVHDEAERIYCVLGVSTIQRYKNAIAISLGASPIEGSHIDGLVAKRSHSQDGDERKRARRS